MNLLEAIILGLIQGISEWLPLSSEGLVAAAGIVLFDNNPSESFSSSLFLHLGTGIAALLYFRNDIQHIVSSFIKSPKDMSHDSRFLLTTTAVSGAFGLPLLLIIENLATTTSFKNTSGYSMLAIGILMILTGCILKYRRKNPDTHSKNPPAKEGILAGIAQGLSVIPGISRSGMTISVMIARGFNQSDALKLSFIMCIPVSIAAGFYAIAFQNINLDINSLIALGMSFLSSLLLIKVLLLIAGKINFWIFPICIGLTIIFSSLGEIVM